MASSLLPSIFLALLVAALAEAQPMSTTLQLQRNTVQLKDSGRAKNFYSATIAVGQPAQKFRMGFDLGGGTTVLPSVSCSSAVCLERRRYDKDASDTAQDIQADGRLVDPEGKRVCERGACGRQTGTLNILSTDLGSGTVKGNFVRDRICLGEGRDQDSEGRCFSLDLLVAYTMTDVPFGPEPYDGTIGLGLEGLSVGPQFNFINALIGNEQLKLPNSFSLHLGGENGGEISFGGYDVKQLNRPIEWVTVAEPEEGRWQVAITAIRVGNNTLEACRGGDCRAALDYGASLLSVPPQLAAGMERAIEALAIPSGYGDGCQTTAMPDLQLVLNDDVTLTLPAEDYVSQVKPTGERSIMSGPAQSCKPRLAHHDFSDESIAKDMFVLGESVLRRYYTFFDGDALKVGFGLAVGSKKVQASALPPVLEAGKGKEWLSAANDEEDGKDSGVILLVQVKLRRSKTISSLGL